MLSTNDKGNIAEAEIVTAAVRLGIPVLLPVSEHLRYDVAFELAGRLIRVQCKWAPRKNDVILVRFDTSRRGSEGFIRSPYSADEIEAVAAYCPDTDQCYFIPLLVVGDRSAMQLRLAPPRNGQRAAVHFAADYEFGAIAQLGERLHGMQEVVGSSPTSSTLARPS